MIVDSLRQAVSWYEGAVSLGPAGVVIADQGKLASSTTDRVVWRAVFGSPEEREAARLLLWEVGQAVGLRAASIHDLYLARGRGECRAGCPAAAGAGPRPAKRARCIRSAS